MLLSAVGQAAYVARHELHQLVGGGQVLGRPAPQELVQFLIQPAALSQHVSVARGSQPTKLRPPSTDRGLRRGVVLFQLVLGQERLTSPMHTASDLSS